MLPFSERLAAAIRRCATPAMVGLDPRADFLPESLRPGPQASPEQIADAYATFCCAVIDVVAELVPAVKPQVAFFEEQGPAGMAALWKVIDYARKKNLLVIIDAKRGDIGSTAEAYARAYLGRRFDERPDRVSPRQGDSEVLDHPGVYSAWGGDAITVNPYVGEDSLQPFVATALDRHAGVFVLVRTSNAGARLFQDLVSDGKPLYRHVAEHVEYLARTTASRDAAAVSSYGAVGAVVGATYPEELEQLRKVMPHAWFLVPGYGAQGGTAREVAAAFDRYGLGAIINSSRSIIFAYRSPQYRHEFGPSRWQEAVEAATREMIAQLRAETPAGRLVN
jgi:orotidine-5'-phosphate decarboxylase